MIVITKVWNISTSISQKFVQIAPNILGIWKSKMFIIPHSQQNNFARITVIEKENNISYKLTSLIADNNVLPDSCCIKENEKMKQFTDNYFMDVQRINFWQSDFNDTNTVDVPLITGEFYEQYFDSDMDLTSLFQ
uniref:Uncharacterized protein n=1 Tax=Strongyloides venezuelensis TaxID=75913 RepID=A0A0K0FS84_STRVS